MIENASCCVYTLTTSQKLQLMKHVGTAKRPNAYMHKVVTANPLCKTGLMVTLFYFDWSRIFYTQCIYSYFFHRNRFEWFVIAIPLGVNDRIDHIHA